MPSIVITDHSMISGSRSRSGTNCWNGRASTIHFSPMNGRKHLVGLLRGIGDSLHPDGHVRRRHHRDRAVDDQPGSIVWMPHPPSPGHRTCTPNGSTCCLVIVRRKSASLLQAHQGPRGSVGRLVELRQLPGNFADAHPPAWPHRTGRLPRGPLVGQRAPYVAIQQPWKPTTVS